jgi:adenine-specific DNA-methyltransferase
LNANINTDTKKTDNNELKIEKKSSLQQMFRFGEASSAWRNILLHGDNLDILNLFYEDKDNLIINKIKGKVKLVYIDPPYSTGRSIINNKQKIIYYDRLMGEEYDEFIKIRVKLLWDLLDSDGVLFIHLNLNRSHYIKVIMDELFGEDKFINEVIWKNSNSGKTVSKNLSRDFHSILWYSKGKNYTFNNIYTSLSDKTKKKFNKDDNNGRGPYRLIPLQKPTAHSNITRFDYIDNFGKRWRCPEKGWRMSEEKLKLLENDNRLYLQGNTLYQKSYWNERESSGKLIGNLWDDITNLQGTNYENTEYPTQKPEKLLQRIITMCTKENDLILDAFAGSGTTLCAAEKLKRRWVGIDSSEIAIKVIMDRLLNINLTKDLYNPKKFYEGDLSPFDLVSSNCKYQ